MEAVIRLKGVKKSFKYQEVLKGVDLEIHKGKLYGIMGYNGSGKTVMFKCICGFLSVDEGEIYVEGKRIGKDIDFPESIGILIENPGFLPRVSGFKNLKKLASIQGRISDDRIKEVMETVGLPWDSKKGVGQYSLGMRERLGIAQAIMEHPRILILDEPFNGLDKDGAREICDLLKSLKEQGTTILLAGHNVLELGDLCDEIYEMEKGELRVWREK